MRAVKLSHLKGDGIGLRMETCVNWGEPTAMVPCLHQGNISIKRKVRVWRDHKCIPIVGAKTRLTCAGHETTSSQGNLYRPENRNWRKKGWTNRHGTVFSPTQYLYQKQANGMERSEIYSSTRCKNPSYLFGLSSYPS